MEALGHSNDEQAIKNRTLVSVEGGSLHALNGFVTDRMKFAGLLGHHAVHDGPSMHSRRYPQARAVQLWLDGPIDGQIDRRRLNYRKLETRSACSRMTLALSVAAVPVGSPLYSILGFDQKGMRGQSPQLSL